MSHFQMALLSARSQMVTLLVKMLLNYSFLQIESGSDYKYNDTEDECRRRLLEYHPNLVNTENMLVKINAKLQLESIERKLTKLQTPVKFKSRLSRRFILSKNLSHSKSKRFNQQLAIKLNNDQKRKFLGE